QRALLPGMTWINAHRRGQGEDLEDRGVWSGGARTPVPATEVASMSLHDFSGLLRAARTQAEPQRLLLVFASAELPADATPEERLRFERGEGGALAPALCVDKSPDD